MSRWLARLPQAALVRVSYARLEPIECSEFDGAFWLRGSDEVDLERLRGTPELELFELDDSGNVRRPNESVRRHRLPVAAAGTTLCQWKPLREWLPIALPALRDASSRTTPDPWSLRLERDSAGTDTPLQPELMVVDGAAWCRWAQSAPEWRLSRLRFAVRKHAPASTTAAESVVVQGTPLPAMRGALYVVQEGIAVPVGFRFQPLHAPRFLARRLGLEPGAIALFEGAAESEASAASFVRIDVDDFIVARRAAVNATWPSLQSGEGGDDRTGAS